MTVIEKFKNKFLKAGEICIVHTFNRQVCLGLLNFINTYYNNIDNLSGKFQAMVPVYKVKLFKPS